MKNDVSFEDEGELEAVTTISHLGPKSSLAVPSGPLRSPARELKSDDSFTDGSLSVQKGGCGEYSKSGDSIALEAQRGDTRMAAFPPRAWMFGGVDSDDSIALEAQNRDLGPPPEASPAWNSAISPPPLACESVDVWRCGK